MYDTTKSKYIDGYFVKYAARPQDDIQENLYQTRQGDYFTAQLCDNCPPQNITPMTAEEARAWVEKHRGAERAAELFPQPKPAADGIQLTVNISSAAAAQIASAIVSAFAPSDIAPLLRGLRELVSHGI